jgi:formate dehydrogenase iron-sulfur subunit
MFEVAWCVMFYTFVLILEFAPAFLERFQLAALMRLWDSFTPWVIVAVLSLFTFAMTHGSLVWTGTLFGILAMWEILMRLGIMPRDKEMPLLLIMAGIMLSTLHQSSLGTLFLISDKVSSLWYTPILPLLFFLSAVMVGPAMVIFEAMVTGKVLRHEPKFALLEPLGRGMPYLITLYLAVRVLDMIMRGTVLGVISPSMEALWWWLEVGLLMAAVIHFGTPEVRERPAGLFVAALATVLALIVHRTGVALVGLNVPEYPAYVPAWSEVMITVGIAAIGILAFRLAVEHLPVYEHEPAHDEVPSVPGHATAGAVGSQW